MNSTLKYLVDRAREPSSWAGAGVGAVLVEQMVPGGLGVAIVGVAAAVCGVLAILFPEGSNAPAAPTS